MLKNIIVFITLRHRLREEVRAQSNTQEKNTALGRSQCSNKACPSIIIVTLRGIMI